MYKTSAGYNAFVCYEKTLGTELEVRSGSEEMIVQLHHALQTERSSSPPVRSQVRRNAGRRKHLDVPGMFFSQHLDVKDTLVSEIMAK